MWLEDVKAVLGQLWFWFFNFLVALGMVGTTGIVALYYAGFFEWALQ